MDLSWKLLQRVLRTVGVPETEIRTKRDLFREAARIGLLADPSAWFGYYEARNESSHTYNRVVAQRVYGKAVEFYQDARALLDLVIVTEQPLEFALLGRIRDAFSESDLPFKSGEFAASMEEGWGVADAAPCARSTGSLRLFDLCCQLN